MFGRNKKTAAPSGGQNWAVQGALALLKGNPTEAKSWFLKGDAAGDIESTFNVGVACDMLNQQTEAKRYFTKAANLGHTHGMINVGIMELQAGNISAARSWLERAERAGDSDAALKLFAIAQMTGDVGEMRRWQHKAENAMRSSDYEMNQFNNQITNSIKSSL